MVNRIKNKEISKFDEYIDIPEVAIEEVTARITLKKLSVGIMKK